MLVEDKVNYKKAYEIYKKLLKDPENTFLVFLFTRQLVYPSLKKNLNRILQSVSGGEVLYDYEELTTLKETLSDRPEGSVGKECHTLFPKLFQRNNLIRISKRKQENKEWLESRHPYNWLARRNIECHDIWHTLTGYSTDLRGEMCLAMFSFAQTRFIGWFLIAISSFLKCGVNIKNIVLMFQAYNNGRKAAYLLAENYNSMFDENLQDARARLNINAHNT
jgi:ubiquinone biosynthesis protein COQ4